MCQFFERLELQLGLPDKHEMFGQNLSKADGEYVLANMPTYFEDLCTAQGFLNLLMKRLQFLLRMVKVKGPLPESNLYQGSATEAPDETRSELERMHKVQAADLARWRRSFDAMQPRTTDHKRTLMITMIELHYETNMMVLDTLLCDVMVYDTMTARFERIIDLAGQHMMLVNDRIKTSSKFNFELGSILPLYLVAQRCRIRETRDKAINMLLDRPRREGVWDSVYSGRLAKWLGEQEDRERDEQGMVPSWARVTGLCSDFDLQSRRALVSCLQQKRTKNGFVEVKRQATIVW